MAIVVRESKSLCAPHAHEVVLQEELRGSISKTAASAAARATGEPRGATEPGAIRSLLQRISSVKPESHDLGSLAERPDTRIAPNDKPTT